MKKFWLTVMVVLVTAIMAVSMAGCTPGDDPGTGGGGGGGNVNLDKDITDTALQNIAEGKKIYLTTIGQSDVEIAVNLLDAAGLTETDYTRKDNLTAAELEDNALVITVLGASAKGLGAAGTDENAELTRANAFAEAQKAGDCEIVALHLGKATRRGALSDPSIRVIVPVSEAVLVVDGGNDDGLFTDLAGENGPLYTFSKSSGMLNSLKFLLGK